MPHFIDPRLYLLAGRPSMIKAWEASIRLDSSSSGTTSLAPAAFSSANWLSSRVRTRIGTWALMPARFLEHCQGDIAVVHGNHHQPRAFQADRAEQGAARQSP